MMVPLKFLIFVTAISGGLLVSTVGAQLPATLSRPGTSTVRAVLASTQLSSVVDAPRYFRLVHVHLAATQTVPYSGPGQTTGTRASEIVRRIRQFFGMDA